MNWRYEIFVRGEGKRRDSKNPRGGEHIVTVFSESFYLGAFINKKLFHDSPSRRKLPGFRSIREGNTFTSLNRDLETLSTPTGWFIVLQLWGRKEFSNFPDSALSSHNFFINNVSEDCAKYLIPERAGALIGHADPFVYRANEYFYSMQSEIIATGIAALIQNAPHLENGLQSFLRKYSDTTAFNANKFNDNVLLLMNRDKLRLFY